MVKFKQQFKDFVSDVFEDYNEVERIYFKVNGTGQQMAFVIVETWRAVDVYLVANERYRNYYLITSDSCYNKNIIEKKSFRSVGEALEYANLKKEGFENGQFDEKYPYRIRRVPSNWRDSPDDYLNRGDHLQRNMNYNLPASHEGIYLGGSKVAHVSPGAEYDFSEKKTSALPRIDHIDHFIGEGQELRIVVHAIERRTPSEICQIANKLVNKHYENYDYDLFKKNCQHFAWLCACKTDKRMTDYSYIFNESKQNNEVVQRASFGNSNATKPNNEDGLSAIEIGVGAVALGAAAGIAAYGLWSLFSSTEDDAARRNRQRRNGTD